MKSLLLRKTSAGLAALLSLNALASAHPGHFALDWFSAPPHAGHESEYATALLALAVTGALFGMCWLASRKR